MSKVKIAYTVMEHSVTVDGVDHLRLDLLFNPPVDLEDDEVVDQVNRFVTTLYGVTEDHLDWRDEKELWIWSKPYDEIYSV